MFVPIMIGELQYRIRFPTRVQIDIEKNAGEFLFGNKDLKVTVFDLLTHIGSTFVQSYLLWKGLTWEHPEMTFEEACALRDAYISAGELDSGEKLTKLTEALSEAILISYGIDPKKMKESRTKTGNRGTGQ